MTRGRSSAVLLAVLLALAAFLGAQESQATSTVLLGDQAVEPQADNNPAGVAEAFQSIASASGTVAKLTVYVDTGSAATTLIAGIYSDNAGHPGPLLGQGMLNAPVAGAWNEVPLPGVPVTSGVAYWITLLSPNGTLNFRDRCCGSGTASESSSQRTLSALPSSWTTGKTYKDGPLSAYGASADAAMLVVSPTTLSFTASTGGADPPPQTFGVSNGGSGTLPWSATKTAPWLTLNPPSGPGPATVTASVVTAGLAAGTYTDTIVVSANGAQGSPQSINVSLAVTTPDTQAPTSPANLVASASGSTVALSWSAATDNVGVTRYDVYRSTTSGFNPSSATKIGQSAGPSYGDAGLAAGTYYYVVIAADAAGNTSAPSSEASATVTAPAQPVYLLGDQTIEAKGDSNVAGLAEAFKTTATATGTVTKVSVFVDSASAATTLTAGLYADNGGHPGALLTQGSLNAPVSAAWNDVRVAAAQVTSGTAYWLAILGPAGAGTLRFRSHGAGGSVGETSAQTGLTSLPATWATGSPNTDGPFSVWAGGDGPSGPPPDQVGQWSSPTSWPIVAVHMSLLPTGNVLAFDAWDAAPNSQKIWNPTTGTFVAVPYAANLFCAGHVLLPDGRTLIVGGNVQADIGIKDATLFDSSSNAWSKAADMSVARWYPTATVLGSGKVLVFGGDAIVDFSLPYSPPYFKEASQSSLPSVFDPASNTWQDLTGAKLTTPLYPFMFQLSDGRILDAGPDVTTRVLNPQTWTWSTVGTSPFDGGDAVMYLPDKIMKSGSYANPDYYGPATYPTVARTAVIDMSQASPAWRETAPMAYPRSYHNLTLLPDGTVFANGGMTTSDGVDLSKAVLPSEIWDPATETWRTVASLTTGREYHSTSLLLPDGRVLMAGGGQLHGRATDIYSGEIYSPPYLFKGARPTISNAPSLINYGSSFTVTTPDAANIQKVALIRTPSVTHAFDENQRYVPVSFTRGSGQLTVQAPSLANTAPPGYYLLFILNGSGVPSTASFVRLPAPYEDVQAPTAPSSLSAVANTGNVTLSWTASTDNVRVTTYDVYRSTTAGFTPSLVNRIAQTTSAPYVDTTTAPGTYYYVVKAEDAAGNLSPGSNQASATVTSSDTVPPTVAITAPTAGQTLAGPVTVTASASDNVGVAGVQLLLDGSNAGPEITVAPYTTSWDTTAVSNGTHTLAAIARDAAGNTTRSSDVSVTVTNTAPPPTTFLLGDQTVEPKVDYDNAGLAEAFKTSATSTGTVRKVTIYVDSSSTATSLVAGIYADNAGHPGALLAQGQLTGPSAGAWNDITVPAASIAAGTSYWITVLSPNGGGQLRFRDRCCGGGTSGETSLQTALASLPATWTTGKTYSDGPLAGYGAGTIP